MLLERALSRCVYIADLDHFNKVYKSVIDSIHKINDNLRQIQAPFLFKFTLRRIYFAIRPQDC